MSEIVTAIKNGADTLKKVMASTNAMKNAQCSIKNPKGICCGKDIITLINTFKNK